MHDSEGASFGADGRLTGGSDLRQPARPVVSGARRRLSHEKDPRLGFDVSRLAGLNKHCYCTTKWL